MLFLLAACGQANYNAENDNAENANFALELMQGNAGENNQPGDKTVKFLWREDKYDEELNATFSSIVIDEEFCKTISDPERAALGYVATFIGNECEWDGEYREDRSNLKCKILTSLNLGYQCSDKHLGFLRKMFQQDAAVLGELKTGDCPTTPDGANSQNTFDEINLTVKGNQLLVSFKANGVNLRSGESWSWTETNIFLVQGNTIRLVKKQSSEVSRESFDTSE